MLEKPKILLGFPTSQHKDYCLPEFAKMLKSLTYPVDIFITDNSKDKSHVTKLNNIIRDTPMPYSTQEFNWKVQYFYSEMPIRDLICNCHNLIRDRFLASDYDYLFSLESDIFIAPNIIEHLLNFNKPVVGIPYFLGSGIISEYVCHDSDSFGPIQYQKPMRANSAFVFTNGRLKTCFQLGLGCLLIQRSVLEKVKFRIDPSAGLLNFDDQCFHTDLQNLNIPVFVDTSNMAFHMNMHWSNLKFI